MKLQDYAWPVIGLAAVAFSAWLLYKEIRGISLDDVIESFHAITMNRWLLAAGSALTAYAALAWYDRIALLHLGRRASWLFVSVCSFTTYALSHNIGASVLSGAVVRYRAYRTRGLTPVEIGLLIALCSFTFALGTIIVAGVVLLLKPQLANRFFDVGPHLPVLVGGLLVLAVIAYVYGSWREFRPLSIGSFKIQYPRLPIVYRQLIAGPLELIGAAGIIYFALPPETNPGFMIVLGIFVLSFSIALLSHAPGGLGVLEVVFITGMPDVNEADVLAALIVFRILYLLIPFALALLVVLGFERLEFLRRWKQKAPGHEAGG